MKFPSFSFRTFSLAVLLCTVLGFYGVTPSAQAGAPPIDYLNPIIGDDSGTLVAGSTKEDGPLGSGFASFSDIPVTTETLVSVGNSLPAGDKMMDMERASVGGFFLVYGEDENSGANGFDLYISKVTTPGAVATWKTAISLNGGSGGPYGRNKIIDVVADLAGGAYVLYFDGVDPPCCGPSTRNTILKHFSSTGVSTTLDTFGGYNADMVDDAAGGVYVLYDIGPEALGGADAHGTVSHYTAAGKDGAFGDVTVSTNVTSTKYGAGMMLADSSGLGGDIIVAWLDDDGPGGTNPGVYVQRITPAGAISFAARGALLLDTDVEGAGFDTSEFLRLSSGFGFDSKYIGYLDTNSEWRVVELDSATATTNWACVPNAGPGSVMAFAHEQGISGGTRGIFVLTQDTTELLVSLYEQADGGTIVDFEQIDDDADLQFVGQNNFYSGAGSVTRTEAEGAIEDGSNGVDITYSLGTSLASDNFDRTSFFNLGGGDCVAGAAAPDAIADLSATAGDSEVDLSWSAPADNGSAITDYIIEFREFPGGVFGTFADGVSTTTSTTVTGLTNGTEYEFRVTAVNAGGNSPASNLVQETPNAPGGRRRSRPAGGANFFLGKFREPTPGIEGSGGVILKGAANQNGSNQPSSPENFQTSGSGGVEVGYKFTEDEEYRSRVGKEKEQALSLLDLIISLRRLFSFVEPANYELLNQYNRVQSDYRNLFLQRQFHHMTGVEYLERVNQEGYQFEYRDPVEDPTEIIADYQKSVMLTYGKSCYGEDLLAYAEEIDYPKSPNWYERYNEVMHPWMEALLGTTNYELWRTTKDINVLESLYLYLFGFCL